MKSKGGLDGETAQRIVSRRCGRITVISPARCVYVVLRCVAARTPALPRGQYGFGEIERVKRRLRVKNVGRHSLTEPFCAAAAYLQNDFVQTPRSLSLDRRQHSTFQSGESPKGSHRELNGDWIIPRRVLIRHARFDVLQLDGLGRLIEHDFGSSHSCGGRRTGVHHDFLTEMPVVLHRSAAQEMNSSHHYSATWSIVRNEGSRQSSCLTQATANGCVYSLFTSLG